MTTRKTNGTAAVLDIVTWESPTSGRQVYLVTRIITSQWGVEYGLLNMDTDEYTTSDLRQAGWSTVASAAVA